MDKRALRALLLGNQFHFYDGLTAKVAYYYNSITRDI